MNNIRYMYLRNAKWEPVGCVAIKVLCSENCVEYGLSVRNPVDAKDIQGRQLKFDRSMAQKIASNRLTASASRAYIPSNATQHDISKAVMCGIVASGNAPMRAVRFAKNWIAAMEMFYR